MKRPNSVLIGKTDALGGDLRASETTPRPIHHQQTDVDSPFGGRR